MTEESVCRLCLSEEGPLANLSAHYDNEILDKILTCTGIQIKCKKGLPRALCHVCNAQIILWYKFRELCQKANKTLISSFPEYFDDGDTQEDLAINENRVTPEYVEIIEALEESDVESMGKADIKSEVLWPEFENNYSSIKKRKIDKTQESQLSNSALDGDNIAESESESQDSEEYKPTVKNKKSDLPQEKSVKKNCEECGIAVSNMRLHMRTHTGEKPFSCDICGKLFGQVGNLKRHVNTHTNERPYACKICPNKSFKDPSGLRSHMVSHSGIRAYQCKICGKSYAQSYTLSFHMRIHNQDKRHGCDFCSKRFISRTALIKHIRVHTGEKPFVCQFCSRGFTSSGNLSSHLRVHTKEKPFKCNYCHFAFNHSSSLKTHLLKKHDNIET